MEILFLNQIQQQKQIKQLVEGLQGTMGEGKEALKNVENAIKKQEEITGELSKEDMEFLKKFRRYDKDGQADPSV